VRLPEALVSWSARRKQRLNEACNPSPLHEEATDAVTVWQEGRGVEGNHRSEQYL
jgi:hypothetical protein